MDKFAVSEAHFLFVTFTAQGHINPALELAKRLAVAGSHVTFATSVFASSHMVVKGHVPHRLSFATYSDGFDDGFKPDENNNKPEKYMSELKRHGTETITKLIQNHNNGKTQRPFTCLVYTLLLPWVAKVAREFHLPYALLWVQPATVLGTYHYYFNGYVDGIIAEMDDKNPSSLINLPGLPPLRLCDLPTLMVSTNSRYAFFLSEFQEQMDCLKEETNPTILVNTFGELEPEALNSVPDFKMVPVGPLIAQTNDSLGVDLCQAPKNYVLWLDTMPDSSVLYISFGTIAELNKEQLEELCKALIKRRRPFLWVITKKIGKYLKDKENEEDNIGSFRQELDEIGLIIPWCDQRQVLNHKSVGCFLTHCGWNSTLESLVSGLPVVAFPQWSDQMTNARLLENYWKTGVRVEAKDGMVESEEIYRCIQAVMEEDTADDFRRNAAKWRDFAAAAVGERGSSYNNVKAFVEMHM